MKHTGYINISRGVECWRKCDYAIFASEEEAKANAFPATVATIKIEWEEKGPQESWINIYRGESGLFEGGALFATKQGAKDAIADKKNYITTTKIKWEENK